MSEMTWTADRDAAIRAMRAQEPPVPYSEIAVHLGVTKNAALSRAQRLGINGGAAASPIKPKAAAPAPEAAPTGARGCQWPMWPDDAPPNFHFCGAERRNPLSSYCAEHDRASWATAPSPESRRMREVWEKRRAAQGRSL